MLHAEFADQVTSRLVDRNQCSKVVYKELLLREDQLAGELCPAAGPRAAARM